ncbi:MAG: polysaccharide biosynthesis/export family protein [Muribaculaceae bacterium]|nr:polysaccharide biosynthesis/export family protein [Muribaculaceae bacterium]
MKTKLYIAFVLCLTMMSCTTVKDNNLAYFKDLPQQATGTLPATQDLGIRIQPDDELCITVSSMVPEATAMFNAPLNNSAQRGDVNTTASPRLATHVVDKDGYITMPMIGRLHAAGMTTSQLEQEISSLVAQSVKDPYVQVQFLGFYVDVMGEVKEPKRLTVTRERFTVLDALAECGDLTEWGERTGVIVIRSFNGANTYYRLNLADSQLMASPAFYLQQNDVVYVEPNKIKIDNSKYNQNNAFKLSVISTITSAVSVVASLVIALAVK